jgi:hypothetical protein
LDPPPGHRTDDGPGHEPEEKIEEREHPTGVIAGMLGSVLLQRPLPQRGGTQRGAGNPTEEATEHERLNP